MKDPQKHHEKQRFYLSDDTQVIWAAMALVATAGLGFPGIMFFAAEPASHVGTLVAVIVLVAVFTWRFLLTPIRHLEITDSELRIVHPIFTSRIPGRDIEQVELRPELEGNEPDWFALLHDVVRVWDVPGFGRVRVIADHWGPMVAVRLRNGTTLLVNVVFKPEFIELLNMTRAGKSEDPA